MIAGKKYGHYPYRLVRLTKIERLSNVPCKNATLPLTELLPKIKMDIAAFVGDAPQFDDITMLCLEYKAKMEF